jgi:hypothetical protein
MNRRRDLLCSFAGAVGVGPMNRDDPASDGAGIRIRRRMLALFGSLPGFQIHLRPWQHTPEWYESPYSLSANEYVRFYRELLGRSLFTLCPRGYGPTSFRLYEAIQAGSIPIYLSDAFWLPYQDELDWREFALIVHEDDLAEIPHLIQDLSTMRIARMQQRLAEVAATHFNLESTCERIVATVNLSQLDTAASLPIVPAGAAPLVARDMRSLA